MAVKKEKTWVFNAAMFEEGSVDCDGSFSLEVVYDDEGWRICPVCKQRVVRSLNHYIYLPGHKVKGAVQDEPVQA